MMDKELLNHEKSFIAMCKFLLWLFTALIISFIGISNVCADTYTNIGYLSDKSNVSVAVTYQTGSNAPLPVSKDTAYYIPGIWAIIIDIANYNFSANTTYEIEFNTPLTTFNNNVNSISVAGGTNSGCSYISNNRFDGHYPRVRFSCTNASNGLTITISNSSGNNIISGDNFRWNYTYLILVNVSQDTTMIEQNNQIIHQNEIIINNQNENTQQIIDNQNENTQKEIESQKVCTNSIIDKNDIKKDGYYLNANGGENANTNFGITDYLELSPTSSVILKVARAGSNVSTCFYNSNKEKISCQILNDNPAVNSDLTLPSNTKYIRFSINKNDNNPQYEITNLCQSGNQAITDSVNGLTSSLTDSSPVSMDSLGNTAGWLPAGPIDSIINLPLNLFNNLLTAFNRTCSPLQIPLPYVNKTLPIPCISTIYGQINGFSTFWNWVGAITSVVILYNYLLQLYKYYDDLTTLKANFISDFGGAP